MRQENGGSNASGTTHVQCKPHDGTDGCGLMGIFNQAGRPETCAKCQKPQDMSQTKWAQRERASQKVAEVVQRATPSATELVGQVAGRRYMLDKTLGSSLVHCALAVTWSHSPQDTAAAEAKAQKEGLRYLSVYQRETGRTAFVVAGIASKPGMVDSSALPLEADISALLLRVGQGVHVYFPQPASHQQAAADT